MAYNLGTLRTRVQQKLDDTSFGVSKLNQFINDAQRDILNSRRFTFMEREAVLTTSAGTDTLVGTPTDMQIPISMRITSPVSYASQLAYIEYEDFDTAMPNQDVNGNSVPSAWRVFNNTLLVYPNADATYQITLKYVKSPTELVLDSDVPEIPESFGELLVLAAYKRALEHNDDYDQAQVIQQQVDIQTDNMDSRFKRQFGLPHILRTPNRTRRFGRWGR